MEIIFASTVIALGIYYAGAKISQSINDFTAEFNLFRKQLTDIEVKQTGSINFKLADDKEYEVKV